MIEDDLIRTEAGRDLPSAPISRRFISRERLVLVALSLAGLEGLLCVLLLIFLLVESRKNRMFVVLDGTGTVVLAPGQSFAQARELQTEQALLASAALLSRGPSAFDLPELQQAMFAPAALSQAVLLRQNEAREFSEKQLHQKPQVTQIDALETRENAILLRLSGQLLRVGFFQQQAFTEVLPFTLDLTLKHNSDLLRNRRQPTLVSDFKLRYATHD